MMGIEKPIERHAHEVMEMMLSSGKAYNRESLLLDIREKFGPEARFHTCSSGGLSPEMLIDFLAEKGKFSGSGDAFYFKREDVCHGH